MDSLRVVLSENRYMSYGEVRTDTSLTAITETDFGYTGQRAYKSFGLMDYNARFYDPYLKHFCQPDPIIPGTGAMAQNRYMYVMGNPIRYTDPSGHSICVGENCKFGYDEKSGGVVINDISENISNKELRQEFYEMTEVITRDIGNKPTNSNALEAVAYLADKAVIANNGNIQNTYKTLSGVFIGNNKTGLMSQPTREEAKNAIYFGDSGFHTDFQDGFNQTFHAWFYINIFGNLPNDNISLFDNLIYGIGNVANFSHEIGERVLVDSHNVRVEIGNLLFPNAGFKIKSNTGQSWMDYSLSIAAMDIGYDISTGKESVWNLGDMLNNRFGSNGGGSYGQTQNLIDIFGNINY